MPYDTHHPTMGIRERLTVAYLRWKGHQVDMPLQPRQPVTTHLFKVEHRPTADQHFVRVYVTTESWSPKKHRHVWTPDWDVRHGTFSLAVYQHANGAIAAYDYVVLQSENFPFSSREAADRAIGMFRESLGYGSRTDHAFVMHSVGGREPNAGFPPAALLK